MIAQILSSCSKQIELQHVSAWVSLKGLKPSVITDEQNSKRRLIRIPRGKRSSVIIEKHRINAF